jgi:hypothetical protein
LKIPIVKSTPEGNSKGKYSSNKLRRESSFLSLIGGGILTLFGVIAIYQSPLLGYFTITILNVQNLQVGGVAIIILGITAIICARWASTFVLGTVLLAISISTGSTGGAFIFLGAFLGLISRFLKKT